MDSARYQQLIDLFETLCDLEAEARDAQLAALRASDPAMADALSDMLMVDDEQPAFLQTPVLRCPVCHVAFPTDTEFCPTHGARLRGAVLQTDPLLGVVLDDRYRVDGTIGRGGMGMVYRGHQINVGRDVAIKVLRHDLQHHPEVARRFEREARIIAGLRHPNTLKLIDFGHTPLGTLYIVNPLLRGRPLDAVITDDGPLSVARVLSLMRQITSALIEAHAAGIVHRDLKPANIFVEQVGGEEMFKVLDFGVAKIDVETSQQTATGALVGTPAYMSPEQVNAEPTIDGRSDLYSLGVVAYVSLSGVLPWNNVTPANVVLKHLSEQPIPLHQAMENAAPPAVTTVIMTLLAKAPSDRPANATALRGLIERIERGENIPSGPTPSSPRRAWSVLGGIVLVLGIAVAFGWLDERPDVRDAVPGPTQTVEPRAPQAPRTMQEVPAQPERAAVLSQVKTSPATSPAQKPAPAAPLTNTVQSDAARPAKTTAPTRRRRPKRPRPTPKTAPKTVTYTPADGLY